MNYLKVTVLDRATGNGVHIRGAGPCNWAQGVSIADAEPFEEAGPKFRQQLKELQRDDRVARTPEEGVDG